MGLPRSPALRTALYQGRYRTSPTCVRWAATRPALRIIDLKEDDALVGAEIVDASDLELVDGGEVQHLAIDPAEEAAALAETPEPEEDDEPGDDADETDDAEPEAGDEE